MRKMHKRISRKGTKSTNVLAPKRRKKHKRISPKEAQEAQTNNELNALRLREYVLLDLEPWCAEVDEQAVLDSRRAQIT